MNKKNNLRHILLQAVRQMKRKTVQNERKAYLTYTQIETLRKGVKKKTKKKIEEKNKAKPSET